MKLRHENFVQDFIEILAQQKSLKHSDSKSLAKNYKDRDDVTFEEYLLDEGIDKMEILRAMATYFQVPAVDVIGEFFDHYLLRLFEKDVMLRVGFIPHSRDNDTLYVIAANPLYPDLRHIISKFVSHDVSFMVGFISDIRKSVEEYYDESITYQPNDIANELMERSGMEVHPLTESDLTQDGQIPSIFQETVNDYEGYQEIGEVDENNTDDYEN